MKNQTANTRTRTHIFICIDMNGEKQKEEERTEMKAILSFFFCLN